MSIFAAALRAVRFLHDSCNRLPSHDQRYDVTRRLLDAGLVSAAEIVHLGADGFVDSLASMVGYDTRQLVYDEQTGT